jgi:cobalamin synthase
VGLGGVGIYLVSNPYPDEHPRYFKPFRPWDDEVWLVASSFVFCAAAAFLIVARFKRRASPRIGGSHGDDQSA